MDLVKALNSQYMKEELPEANIGDTVRVGVRIKEGEKSRIQNLPAYIACERDAIAAIALQHYAELRKRGYAFSGDYELNEAMAEDVAEDDDIDALMDNFVTRYVLHDDTPGTQTFVQTFLDAFVNVNQNFVGIKPSTFSSHLRKALIRNGLPIIDDRDRMPGQKNPQAVLKNLRLNPLNCGAQL